MCTEAAGKPGSVVDDHFSQYRRCHRSSGAHLRLKAVRAAPCRGLGLLRVGFAMPLALRRERWALTPPFHPYLPAKADIGGLLSVALSVGSRPPGITWHPALWSPDFPRPPEGGRGRLAARAQSMDEVSWRYPGLRAITFKARDE